MTETDSSSTRAAERARAAIHDNDIDRLKQLLADYPALLSWRGDDSESSGGLLGFATDAYGDAGDADRERWFTRGACAELLIDAGAVVMPSVCHGLLESRARGLLQLFHAKRLLPRTLEFLAARGDLEAVTAALGNSANDRQTVNAAFVSACRFGHEAVALLLLERAAALDPELAKHIDAGTDRRSFIQALEKAAFPQVAALGLWNVFVMHQIKQALHERNLEAFVGGLQRNAWLLDEAFVSFQDGLIATAAFNHGVEQFIVALLDLDPAILRRRPPPPSQAIEHAFTYGNAHLIPVLTRIWPLPDDLPHAAGTGDLARVQRWFDADGRPALGHPADHAPATSVHPREAEWGAVGVQEVLDTALAWSVISRHFDVADFLLGHGANVNTNWNSHEPASILHHLVFLPNPYESMQFLIDRGIDMTISDYRWKSNAANWARYGNNDERMARWLEDAQSQRDSQRSE